MREKLKDIDGCRERFKGRFVRIGFKKQFRGPPKETILLCDVVRLSDQEKVTEHLWLNMTKQIEKINLVPGDMIAFDTRAKKYIKGYQGYRDDVPRSRETDYKLSYPTKIEKI